MTRATRSVRRWLCGALCITALTGTSAPVAGAETVILASGLAAPYLPYPMAVDGGFMRRHGVDAVYKIFPSGVEAIVAVGAGEAHVSHSACPTVLKAGASGADLLLVARNVQNPKELKLVVSRDVQRATDLRGRNVGLVKGSSVDWYASKYFVAFGLEEGNGPGRVHTLHIAAPEWIPAMNRGDIVGFFGWEPWLGKALEVVDGAHILHRGSDNGLHVLNNCLVFNARWAEHSPAVAVRVMRALVEAHDGVAANLAEAVALASKPMRIPADVLAGMADGFVYRVEFTQADLDYIREAAAWLEGKALLEPGQGEQVIARLVDPELLRRVAPSRVGVGR